MTGAGFANFSDLMHNTPMEAPVMRIHLAPLRIDGARLMREQRAAQRQGKK